MEIRIKKLLEDLLKLSEKESELFVALMKTENKTTKEIKKDTNLDKDDILYNAKKLEQKGMIIEINKEFKALHPRFAIVNRYRRLCQEDNIEFKKNIQIDNLGIMIENYTNTIDNLDKRAK